MESRAEKSVERMKKGYNCAQAVACTYCDLVGIDEVTMFKLTEALGHGMGNMEGTCGAISGAVLLAGMKGSTGNIEKPESKQTSYGYSKAVLAQFQAMNGATICKDLKGAETGKVLRACSGCIKDAALLAEQIIFPELFKD